MNIAEIRPSRPAPGARRMLACSIWLLLSISKAETIRPFLAVGEPQQGQFQVSWPASATDYVLEWSTNLVGAPAWQEVSETPELGPTGYSVSLAATNSARFFRLRFAQPAIP